MSLITLSYLHIQCGARITFFKPTMYAIYGIAFCIFVFSIIVIRHPNNSVTTTVTVGTRHVLPRVSRQSLNNAIGHQSCMLNYTAYYCSPTFHLASVFCNFLFPLRPLIFSWSYFRGKGLILYDLLVSLSIKTIFILPQACPVCPNIKFQSLNRVPDKCAPLIYVSCSPPPRRDEVLCCHGAHK
jgi:hypothetical protein